MPDQQVLPRSCAASDYQLQAQSAIWCRTCQSQAANFGLPCEGKCRYCIACLEMESLSVATCLRAQRKACLLRELANCQFVRFSAAFLIALSSSRCFILYCYAHGASFCGQLWFTAPWRYLLLATLLPPNLLHDPPLCAERCHRRVGRCS